MRPPIYLDANATAPVRPEAVEVMREALAEPLNASSVHRYGQKAKQRVESAREALADRVSCHPSEVFFTGSGTEANNMTLLGRKGRVVVSAIEHASVLRCAPDAARIPVDADGVVDLAALDALLPGAEIVSVMLANNETGVIQPINEVAALCRRHGALLHCDAVQGLGKVPVDVGLLGADLYTFAAHKMGGPVGAAALVVRQGTVIPRLLHGGGQERGYRAGTENVAALAGWKAAIDLATTLESNRPYHAALEIRLIAAGGRIAGQGTDRLPNTTSVRFPGIPAETQLIALDLAGIAVSAGSACSSGRIEPSHVLGAMAFDTLGETIRISSSWASAEADYDRFFEAWSAMVERSGHSLAESS